MADIDLPVWSFRCNWKEGVTERLGFLTDVLRAGEGAEQRRSLRPTPRRSVEADYLLRGPERTFYDLFINRLGGLEMTAPLYWDIVRLTSATVAGATVRIEFDNTRREFAVGLAILAGTSALDYEVIEIEAMDAAGIDLANPTVRAWPRGTTLMPLRRAVIEDMGDPVHQSGGVATVSSQLQFVVENPWTPAADDSPEYLDLPVFLSDPNWVEPLAVAYDKEIVRLDPGTGLPYQVDQLGRAVIGQSHRWFLPGREKLAGFRDLLYRHRGRAGAFWLPTFKHDLRLRNSPGSGATQIEVDNVGFGYTGGPTSGREHIAITHDGGTICRKILSVIPGTTSASEKVNLDAPLGLALSPGVVRRISFLDTARFDQDEFEITHHGGLDGLSEASALFRTFKNTRTAPLPISYPIPEGVMGAEACGVEVPDSDCYEQAPPDPGWDWTVKVEYPITGSVAAYANMNLWVGPLNDPLGPPQITYTNTEEENLPGWHVYLGPWGNQMYWRGGETPADTEFLIYLQWPVGTVAEGSTARLSFRRWFQEEWTVLQPTGHPAPEFGIQGLWPLPFVFVMPE